MELFDLDPGLWCRECEKRSGGKCLQHTRTLFIGATTLLPPFRMTSFTIHKSVTFVTPVWCMSCQRAHLLDGPCLH